MNFTASNSGMDLVFGTDTNYAMHLGVLLRSIARTNTGETIRAHIFHHDVSQSLQVKVAICARPIETRWYAVSEHDALQAPPLLHISNATYLRLIIPEFLHPSIKRVLHLDIDIIVNGNLKSLWDTDLAGRLCAAVVDPGVSPTNFAHKYGLSPLGKYFNAGVMLIDLEGFRSHNIMSDALVLLGSKDEHYEYADQDALNILLWDRWHPLDPTWNFQRKFLYDDFVAWRGLSPKKSRAPAVIHFTEAQKPWRRSEWHPYAWLYLKNLLQTPFRAEVLRASGIGPIVAATWWLRSIFKRPVVFYKNEFRFRDHLAGVALIKRIIRYLSRPEF